MHRRGVLAAGRRRSAGGGGPSPAFTVAARAGEGQSATTSSLGITIPAGAAVGEVAVLFVGSDVGPTLTTPSGWNLRQGPNTPTANVTGWVFTRTLQAGDPGTSVTLAFSTSQECGALMLCFEGVTETGIQSNNVGQGTAGSTHTLPTLTGVPAGAMLVAGTNRRRSGVAATITMPAPYTVPASNGTWANAHATVNTFGSSGYAVTAGGGSVGGEDATSAGGTSIGNTYLVSLPSL